MSFGKHFIITVSLSLLFPHTTLASDEYSKAVINAYSKILKAETKLEKRAIECENKPIDASKIKPRLPAIPRKKLANAIFFLSSNNYLQCVRREEAGFLLAVHSAKQLIERALDAGIKLTPPQAKEISKKTVMLNYPVVALQEVQYLSIPKDMRDKIELIEEFKHPFDGIKLLQELKILP